METSTSISRKNARVGDTVLMVLIYGSAFLVVAILLAMIGYIMVKGLPLVNWEFLTTKESVLKGTHGILPNIINTIYIIVLTILFATPLGVGGAIYLCEYAHQGRLTQLIEFTTETLSGIPSVVYGLFGALFFNSMMKLQYSILSGCLTLTIMILPIIVTTTRESIKSVPMDYREGAMAMGAGKWYVIRTIILPSSFSGILTAIILAIGRIVGESAALIFTAGIGTTLMKTTSLSAILGHAKTSGATLTVQLYQYMLKGQNEYAYAIAAVLMVIVLAINLLTRLMIRGMKSKAQ